MLLQVRASSTGTVCEILPMIQAEAGLESLRDETEEGTFKARDWKSEAGRNATAVTAFVSHGLPGKSWFPGR